VLPFLPLRDCGHTYASNTNLRVDAFTNVCFVPAGVGA
jgi:hypothetical protein